MAGLSREDSGCCRGVRALRRKAPSQRRSRSQRPVQAAVKAAPAVLGEASPTGPAPMWVPERARALTESSGREATSCAGMKRADPLATGSGAPGSELRSCVEDTP